MAEDYEVMSERSRQLSREQEQRHWVEDARGRILDEHEQDGGICTVAVACSART